MQQRRTGMAEDVRAAQLSVDGTEPVERQRPVGAGVPGGPLSRRSVRAPADASDLATGDSTLQARGVVLTRDEDSSVGRHRASLPPTGRLEQSLGDPPTATCGRRPLWVALGRHVTSAVRRRVGTINCRPDDELPR
ncbi:hypothetical protein [Isoptericola haloaureus]|uniref:Uncharacterized protein n=1 Tax=Isoptericola haloaureus TaxID=1542902 RepID=A0ABU7Z397_9MICO